MTAGGQAFDADAVVLATPAFAASALLAPLDEALARQLAGIEYASSATVTLGYRADGVAGGLAGFGFVVPFAERRPLLACTFASRKYPGRAPEGHELLARVRRRRAAARSGRAGRRDAGARSCATSSRALLGIAAEPMLVRVERYRRAMPQYAVGHLDRVAAIEARAAALPGLALAGAAYRGVGIPDCIHSGEVAADALAGRLGRG